MSDERWMKLMELGERFGCHQMPERSFFIGDRQLPVCARCTGVILGELIAVSAIVKGKKVSTLEGALLMTLMGLDWYAQESGVRESNNLRRLITGIYGGFGLTYLYWNTTSSIARLLTKQEQE